MLRQAALWAYAIGGALGVYLSVVGIRAVLSVSEPLNVASAVVTFLPMVVLVGLVFWAQLRASRFLLVLASGVAISAVLALFSLLNHGFPELSARFALFHLAVVGITGALAIYTAVGVHGNEEKAL